MIAAISRKNKIPVNGVIVAALIAAVITLPALVEVNVNGAPVPVAFFAVDSIGVVGLYRNRPTEPACR